MSQRKIARTWKLAEGVREDVQALAVTGFGALGFGRALMLECCGGEKGAAWLRELQALAPITDAVPPHENEAQPRAAAIAFSWRGLDRLGLGKTTLASFARPFREGMFQKDRLRRLGDRRGDEWQSTVIPGGPVWSANPPARENAKGPKDGFEVPEAKPEEEDESPLRTDITVHALLLIYTQSDEDAENWSRQIAELLGRHHVVIVRERSLLLNPDEKTGLGHEHFGFADGLSQPSPWDADGAVLRAGKPVTAAERVNDVPLGEFLFGHVNGHGELAPGPIVPQEREDDPTQHDPRLLDAELRPHPEAEGFFDLGCNGSYLVCRELKQDVAQFWASMERNAANIRAQDPENSTHVTPDWLAERIIGRNKEGHLLCPAGHREPDEYGWPDNDFLFWDDDPHGLGCPPGSHVRRAHPRDALAPDAASKETLLRAANNHRILRRGRKYGTLYDANVAEAEHDRGLLFICLNTDITRQFEFVQQTWLMNSSFATLYGETDPLVGPSGPMTIREDPLRRIVDVETYVQMVGGDYFFLPSMSALRYLAML